MKKREVHVVALPKAVAYDLLFIAQTHHVEPGEWLLGELQDVVQAEKVRIIEAHEQAFVKGLIDAEEFSRRTGLAVTRQLAGKRFRREEHLARETATNRKGFQNFVRMALEQAAAEQHHDRHMKRVIREVDKQQS